MEGFWKAIFPGYSLPGLGENIGYISSAVIGVLVIVIVFWILTHLGRRAVEQD
jgi:PDGLE domain-containing protein